MALDICTWALTIHITYGSINLLFITSRFYLIFIPLISAGVKEQNVNTKCEVDVLEMVRFITY